MVPEGCINMALVPHIYRVSITVWKSRTFNPLAPCKYQTQLHKNDSPNTINYNKMKFITPFEACNK
jgi:hypothetical protein